MQGRAAWLADEVRNPKLWRYDLTGDQVAEIHATVAHTIKRGVDPARISQANFPLPLLGPELQGIARELGEGIGFALICGLPVEDLSGEAVARAFLGLGAWLGHPVPQNAEGHLLGHVIDLGDDPDDPKTRIYTTNARQPFHVDSCDYVGLLCLHRSRTGGTNAICSSIAIVDEIERTRPDLASVLGQPFYYDRKGEVPAGKAPYYQMPIVHRHDGLTSVFYARDFITSAQQRFDHIPRLTPAQTEALDMVDRLAADDRFRLDVTVGEGHMLFLHNHQILHARTAYTDWPEPRRRRHLLRLWLSPHDARPLPAAFEERYGPIVEGRPRGGIYIPGVTPRVALTPAAAKSGISCTLLR